MGAIRDLLLLAILFPLVPVCFFRPWIGILAWFWVAYFVPHGFTWGFGRTLPIAMSVGVATLLGVVMSGDRPRGLPGSWTLLFLVLFAADITVSSLFAFEPTLAWGKWDWVMKSLLMTMVTISLFQDRHRLRWLYLVTALSLGLHGLRGAIWVLRTAGGSRVFGPERSFFGDNNMFGLVLCMSLPLLLYLAREESRRWLRRSLRVLFCASIVAALFTYSRGAFLALLTVLAVLAWRSPWRVRFAVAGLVGAVVVTALAPVALKARLESITAQESADTRDTSAAGRLQAWHTATEVAIAHPWLGQGFRALWNVDVWKTYYGSQYLVAGQDAHSIYFEVLAEHGFVGLSLYLAILASTLWSLRRVRRRWRGDSQYGHLSRYAEMTQTAVYPFLLGGAFLSAAYFDLYFLLVGTGVILRAMSKEAEQAVTEKVAASTGTTRQARLVARHRQRLPLPTRRAPEYS
jgi:probable O-glycosylation ligase (exosortase A-associated)